MDKTYEHIFFLGKEDITLFKRAAKVREIVFCNEQGYSLDEELDDVDETALHILLLDGDRDIATGRMFFDDKDKKAMHFGRVAVVEEYRGKKIGKIVMEKMESKAKELGANKGFLSAQCRVSDFYRKCGYTSFGEIYMDEHVKHQMMRKVF